MDADTIRTIAGLALQRSVRCESAASSDGLSRLGASRALVQFARDLNATANELEREARKRKRPR
ncbi:hypothetical protein BES08_29020 (plasmid) [Novosphingobium resinovorum]|uniref:Uncharacterized protein n=1 Tax=Novosphingobium resinovorum TaxID=158500 RepID=A0A1D8AFE9_9SPHN|nr:hypothetical protein BES08_29020 [Novosphingobium resinovorum]